MKLILEDNFDNLKYEVEMNESTAEKTYVVKGIFSSPGKKNRNGRIYPAELWEDNVSRYQEEIKNNTVNTLMEAEHPPRTSVDMWKAVGKIRTLEMRDGKVYGEAIILNNQSKEANQLKALIDANIPIGVSTRGVGKIGKGSIVEEFNLITVDFVASPSDYAANLTGIQESEELFTEDWILKDKEFFPENGKYICTENGCSLQGQQELGEGTGSGDVAQTPCQGKAKQLIESLNTFLKSKEEPRVLSESEIKARELLGLDEGIKQRFGGHDFEFDGEEVIMLKDKKEIKRENHPMMGSAIQKKMIKSLNENELNEDKAFEQAMIDFQEQYGKFVIATSKLDKKAGNRVSDMYKEIEKIVADIRKVK